MMVVEFDNGEVLKYEPHTFMLLESEFSKVVNWYRDDVKLMLDMEKEMEKSIIGQEMALEKIAKSLRRNRVGIRNPKKPIGSFMFLGPTGVGKTHIAKKLAEFMFGDEDSLIRLDMSEFQEKHSISRLIGSPPGYVGHEDGGQLTEKVRRKPYSIVLFDEIEKANKEIYNTLLQMLDDGQLTDSAGRKVNFKNCMVIMTSNVGVKKLSDFADLSSDELIGGFDEIKGKKIRIEGYLEEFSLSRKEADDLIMAAREIAYK